MQIFQNIKNTLDDVFNNDDLHNEAIDYCDQLYSETFRSVEVFKGGDYINNSDLMDELIELLNNSGMSREEAKNAVNETVFVWLVNYKGEGEGIEVLETVKHLRIFRQKYCYN